MTSDPRPRPDGARSWLVALAGSVAMGFTFGTPFSYGIFRDPFSAAFGIAPVTLSVAFAVMLFTFYAGSGVVGLYGIRAPSRAILLACAAAAGLVAPALFVVDSLLGLTLVFAVLGLSHGTVVVLVASVVPQWFEHRRATATGLVFTGSGLGLFVLPPLWQWALTRFGIRRAFLVVLSVTAAAFLLGGLACRRPPWLTQSTDTAGDLTAWLRRLAGTRDFRLLFVGVAFSFAWYQLLAAYAVDLFASSGLSPANASAAFGLIGGVSIASRLGSGYVADRTGPRRAYLASLALVLAGTLLLYVHAVPALIGAVVLLGLGLGGLATLYIPLATAAYSFEKDTALVGVINTASGTAALAMPLLGTATVSYTGSYTLAISITLAVTVLGLLATAAGTEGA